MNAMPPPIQPQGPNDGDTPPDPAMDSLLREWLGEDTPPNLIRHLDAIQDAAKNPLVGTSLFTNEELVAAVNRAFKEVESGSSIPSRVRPLPHNHANPYNQRGPYAPRSPYARWGALAIAASLLGLVASYPFWRARQAEQPVAKNTPSQGFPPLGSGSDSLFEKKNSSRVADSKPKVSSPSKPESANPNPSRSSDAAVAAQSVAPPPKMEPKTELIPPAVAQTRESRTPRTSPSDLRSDQQVVAVIDQQLEHLWNRLKINPGKTTDSRAVEDRLALVLIGRLPTDAEREWGRKAASANPSLDTAKALARRWVESEEFDRHWALALSDYYLDRSIGVPDKDSLTAFDTWLQESIQRNEPLGLIEGRLIGSDIQGSDPSAFWLRRWIAIGRQSTGKLFAASGRSPAGRGPDQWAALESLALQGSRLSGVPVISDSSIAQETLSIESLLGTAAAFASVFDSKQPKPTDKTGFYVSDAEGKVSLVSPLSPDGKLIAGGDNPRANLAKWFDENAQARGPLVDFVWKRLVGQPLVPSIGLTDAEGLEDRKDLLDFLATEAQSQRASLRQIVSWIAMSSPMYFESRAINAQEFLALDPSTLASWQKQTRLFANYPPISQRVRVLDRLNAASRWMKPSEDNSSSSVLAQPAIISPGVKNPTTIGKQTPSDSKEPQTPLAWTVDRVHYEVSNLYPYDRIGESSAELASSSLPWETVVERAFLVCLSRYPSAEERKQANGLLDLSHGDRRLASSRLLNVLLGHL